MNIVFTIDDNLKDSFEMELLEPICRMLNGSDSNKITLSTMKPICLLSDDINNRSHIWFKAEITEYDLSIEASIDGRISYEISIPYIDCVGKDNYELIIKEAEYKCYFTSCGIGKIVKDKEASYTLFKLLAKAIRLSDEYIKSEYEFTKNKYL